MQKVNQKINANSKSNFEASSETNPSIGTIDLDQILQVLDTLGNANYTFRVDDEDNNPFTFTNLIVREWVDGEIPFPAGDGSVICSDYQSNYWRFATISAPKDWIHPVSGTREFGFKPKKGGGAIFYTRGVDRITSSLANIVSSFKTDTFENPDNLWASFQDKIASFVNANGGSAIKTNPIIGRPN